MKMSPHFVSLPTPTDRKSMLIVYTNLWILFRTDVSAVNANSLHGPLDPVPDGRKCWRTSPRTTENDKEGETLCFYISNRLKICRSLACPRGTSLSFENTTHTELRIKISRWYRMGNTQGWTRTHLYIRGEGSAVTENTHCGPARLKSRLQCSSMRKGYSE